MAGAFDKIKSSVNRSITTINVKTSSSLEKAKINTHIETLQSEINKLFSLTGEMAYYKWKNNRTDMENVYANFEIIKGKFEEIEELKKEMDALVERDNGILGGNAQGAPNQAAGNIATITCPSCGTTYAASVKFCQKCGAKLQ